MTALTICSELTSMKIRVAIRTLRAHVLEHHRLVAFGAGHRLVHTAQRIFRRIVIEFRHRPDRFPACVRVAVLAGADGRPMRVGHLGARTLAGLRAGLLRATRRHDRPREPQHRQSYELCRYPRVPEVRRFSFRLSPRESAEPRQEESDAPTEELPWTCLTKQPLKIHRRVLFQTPNSLDCVVICNPDSGNTFHCP